MSYQNKEFWMPKAAGLVPDGNPPLNNGAPRIESKRSHHWFVGHAESEPFPSKKQAVQRPSNQQPISGASHPNVPHWESTTSFQPVQNQFIDRSFGYEAERPVNFAEQVISPAGADARKGIDEQFANDISVGLTMSHSAEDIETCFNYSGIRKVKVNQVKDSQTGFRVDQMGGFHGGNPINVSTCLPYNRPMNVPLVYGDQSRINCIDSAYDKGHDNVIAIGDTSGKGGSPVMSFGGFNDDPNIIPLAQPVLDNLDKACPQSSPQVIEADEVGKQTDASGVDAAQPTKPRTESVPKEKIEKPTRKEAPNSFPSNVRSLMATGILDGVPVKYVAVSREEFRGVIKGSGYVCGCQSCNYSNPKALNAYEFERHAGCKTKHPNNHIYFDNGKTIYQIVQELKSTPASALVDTMETAFGAPVNEKLFRIWKESFQRATRELQRIYGKDELNL